MSSLGATPNLRTICPIGWHRSTHRSSPNCRSSGSCSSTRAGKVRWAFKNVGLSGADGEAVAVDSLFDDQRRKVHALEKGESVSEASLYRLAKRAAAGRGMKEEL